MRTIYWRINVRFVGAVHSGNFEVEDDTPEEEINKMVEEQAWKHIELEWSEKLEK